MKSGVSVTDANPAGALHDRPNLHPRHSCPSDSYTLEVSDFAFGWHPVAEFDVMQGGNAYPTVRSYMWGLDVTGTVHGAGGVGGLLLTTDGDNHQIPLYDANGNVHGLVDASTGTLEAVYSYSAFGQLLGYANPAGGTYAQDNPIRFASKWYDTQTGLYQYNYRMYSPRLGRFITRDPIGEYGGLNLYAYCRNGPVDDWDYLGLWLGDPFGEGGWALDFTLALPRERGDRNHPTGRNWQREEPSSLGSLRLTWRAFERYTSRGGSLGRPMTLLHSAKAEGVGGAANSEYDAMRPIADMADRLRREIDALPAKDLRRVFLETQRAILVKISQHEWSEESAKWVNDVVKRFMDPLFDALGGRPNAGWKETFDELRRLQVLRDYYGIFPERIANHHIRSLELYSAREMALTHILQDLYRALLGAGKGDDADWQAIGRMVEEAQKEFFGPLENAASTVGGILIDPSLDVGKIRDVMRDSIPNETPTP